MHTFSQYDQLLTKYLLNELDDAEEADLLSWLGSSAENRAYLEKFAAAWNLSSAPDTIRDIDVDQEWEKHRMNIDNTTSGTVIRMQPYLQSIRTTTSKYKKWWKFPAIAAACVVVAIALYLMKTGNKPGNKPGETRPAEVVTAGSPPSPSRVQTVVTNRSAVARALTLGDGSGVVLYPNSELIYDSLFSGDTRSVLLRGRAYFKVASNKARPFIVTHGNIATHVLGTRFSVWAPLKEKMQRIRLYDGKVMIRAADGSSKLRGSYYLLPGQEFVYDELHSTGEVRTFGTGPSVAAAAPRDNEDITIPDHSKGSWFMFNNQPLSEVFDELQSVYNVRIKYKAADLHKMYFIGKFDTSDSLHVILSRMATLYHLKVIREQDKYTISK
ncbi:MAG TPA: FecR domain-containing protein [Puia sp.]|jgi:ferric-dicitrate binding protein FerR (iron transport regulator)|nr:FecR domain-containing protein [Puia sp.]